MRAALLALLSLAACENGGPAPLRVPPLELALADHWPEPASLPDLGAGRIVVTNNGDDTVSLFALERITAPDFGELARLPVGVIPVEPEGPHHAALDPAGEFYYIGISNLVPGGGSGPHGAHGTGTADGYILKYRASDHRLVASTRVDRNPGDLTISADGSTLFVTHFDLLKILEVTRRNGPESDMDARVAVVDASTMTLRRLVPVCPAPHGVRLSPDGRHLYIACYSDELAIVDVADPAYPVTRLPVAPNAGGPTSAIHEPYAVTVSPASGDVWVSCLRSGDIHVYDPVAQRMVRTVMTGGAPVFGAFNRAGDLLYMPHQGDDRVSVIRPSSGEILRRFELRAAGCLNVHQVELTPNEEHALIVCEGNHTDPGSLLVAEASTGRVLRRVEVGVFPDYVGILRRPR
jgi:DNA-binding beta-propeller fold protein YncE